MKTTNHFVLAGTLLKASFLFVFFVLFRFSGVCQNIGINTTGATPNASALLDIDASPGNNKGLLIPRLTTSQMNAIAFPATGLIIYNTDCNSINYYNGTTWIALGNTGSVPTPGAITGNTTPCQNATGIVYSIAAVTGATGYNWTVPTGASVATGQGTTSITVNFGTTNGNVCVTAYNACGSSNASCTAITLQTAPAAPTATAASNIAQTSFDVNWNASAGATTYYLDVATDVGFTSLVTGYNNLNVGNVTTYSVNTNLTCATTYYYRVRAENSCGTSSNSNTITTTSLSTTFEDDFSTNKGWVTQDATKAFVNTIGGYLDIFNIQDNTDNSMVYDLGSVSDSQWLLRWKFTPVSEAINNGSHIAFGLSSSNAASNVSQDALLLFSDNNIDNGRTFHLDNTVWPGVQSANQSWTITMGTSYYMELVRTSTTSFQFKVCSDAAYTIVLASNTIAIPATIVGLRYIKYMNAINGLAGTLGLQIDDLKFWNNRTTPCP